MYGYKPWPTLIALTLAACPVEDKENDTLFASLTATDTDASATATTPTEESGTTTDGTSTTPGTTDVEESESGPVGPCNGGVCAQPPPEGWFGPIVRWDNDGSMPPLCAEDWPDDAFTLMGGYVDPGPAQCECSCGISIGSLCYTYAYNYTDAMCSQFGAMLTANMDCNTIDIVDGSSLYLYASTQGMPTCNDEVVVELPEPSWDQEVRGCRGAEFGDECDDNGRQCLPRAPAGFENWLCIFSEGDVECPAGDYSEKTLLYSGVADTRACGTCVCDAAPSSTCAGNWEVYDNDDCTGSVVHTQALSIGCTNALTGAGSLRIALDGGTECPIFKDTAPTGSIAPEGAFTYCCTPP